MKRIAVFLAVVLMAGFSIAQDDTIDEMPDGFEGLFDGAEDIEAAEQNPLAVAPVQDKEPAASPGNVFFRPLSFFGHLDAAVGFGALFVEGKPDFTGYFGFQNDLSFSARGSKNLAVKGTVSIVFPHFALSVSELYFDYLLLDRLYITGGKKSVGWGYPQLFSGADVFGFGLDSFSSSFSTANNLAGSSVTNVLSDSENSISVLFQLPFAIGNLCAAALYPMNAADSVPSFRELSFVGSLEMTLLNTSMNIFARRYPAELDKTVLGLELKRTVLGADVYAQGMVHIYEFSELPDNTGYSSIVATGGLYKWWEIGAPMVGFNAEYQYVYSPAEEDAHNHYLMFVGGASRLGPRKNIKVGVDWRHSFVAKTGDATLGMVLSGVLPHADWKSAFGMSYAMAQDALPRMFLGTSLVLALGY